jgi:FtsP/CotA-like multicopper oxidase with cupredoxin domain
VSETTNAAASTGRRDFLLKGAAVLALPAMMSSLSSCAETKAANTGGPLVDSLPPANPAIAQRAKAEAMDAMHEKGVKAFPAKTEGKGNQLLQPRIENSVKVYDLSCEEVQWEVEPGRQVRAWAYNNQVPGPQIRVREGDRVRVNLTNKLPESTAIHFHGLELPNDQDGVPFITQPPVKSGESYTYEFTVPNAGSHMYHSHHNAAVQVGQGLLGAFIVEPRSPLPAHRADVDYVMVLNDGSHGYTLNGKGFPATEPLVCKQGQTVRIRFMNEGMMIHPMHLHGISGGPILLELWPDCRRRRRHSLPRPNSLARCGARDGRADGCSVDHAGPEVARSGSAGGSRWIVGRIGRSPAGYQQHERSGAIQPAVQPDHDCRPIG